MRANSTASRILEHLRELPPGQEQTSTEIGKAIGIDAKSISSSMFALVKSGRVAATKDSTRPGLYKLGNADRDAFDADSHREGRPEQRSIRAADAAPLKTTAPSSVFALGGAVPHPASWKGKVVKKAVAAKRAKAIVSKRAYTKRAKPAPPPIAAPRTALATRRAQSVITVEPTAHVLGVALFNTGDLVLEAPGAAPLRLNRAQTQDLLAYLLKLDQLAAHLTERKSA